MKPGAIAEAREGQVADAVVDEDLATCLEDAIDRWRVDVHDLQTGGIGHG